MPSLPPAPVVYVHLMASYCMYHDQFPSCSISIVVDVFNETWPVLFYLVAFPLIGRSENLSSFTGVTENIWEYVWLEIMFLFRLTLHCFKGQTKWLKKRRDERNRWRTRMRTVLLIFICCWNLSQHSFSRPLSDGPVLFCFFFTQDVRCKEAF